MSRDGWGLGLRIGSAFENGYGDEGLAAKVVYGVGLLILGVFSLVAAPFYFASKRRQKRRDKRAK